MKRYLLRLALNAQRSALFSVRGRIRYLRWLGFDMHPTARIMQDNFLGARAKLHVGAHSFIGIGGFFDGNDEIRIGEAVRIGPYARLLTGTHSIASSVLRNDFTVPNIRKPILIERGCWLGMNVSVMPGVTIREGCVVGAGSLVTRSTEPNGLYVGSPARRVRDLPIGDSAAP